jgi:hypothetical protein
VPNRQAIEQCVAQPYTQGNLDRQTQASALRKIMRRTKMHHAMKDLPIVDDYGDGFCSRLVEWGGMIVSYETFPKGVDATPLFKGLPDDMCQSPHWGHILRGRVRIKTMDGDFVLKTGDVYYLEPGHVPVFEEDTEVLEFSPKKEYQQTIDIVNKNMAAARTTT